MTTTAVPVPGETNQYQTQTQSIFDRFSDTLQLSRRTDPWTGFSAWTNMSACMATASLPALPAAGRPGPSDPATPPYTSFDAACTGWPCVHTVELPVTDCSQATAANTSNGVGGSCNSLADVAQYYYKTDLRPVGTTGFNGVDVSARNKVPASSGSDTTELDKATWQHMTTFTMGLGISGTVAYNPNYKNKPLGTFTSGLPNEPFQQIRCQDASNALLTDPNLCLNWTAPVANAPTAVDDLWHTAVNGRGQYFSAADPDSVLSSLQTTLAAINAQSAAGTGATTTTQEPIPGDDLAFSAGFKTVEWSGDIKAQQLYTGNNTCEATADACTALGGTSTGIACTTATGIICDRQGSTLPGVVWSAQDKLDGQVSPTAACDYRNIYVPRMGATDAGGNVINMVPFTWNTRACDTAGVPGAATTALSSSEQSYFTSTSASGYASPFPMSNWAQFLDMTDGTNGVDQRVLAQGPALVNFVRGQRLNENITDAFASGSTTQLFRRRTHVLGDIIGSQPAYVRTPNAQFTDTGYASFKTRSDIIGRAPMIYAGSNDGMLHAFNVGQGVVSGVPDPTGGLERWAIIPTPVLPNLYRLGDTGYSEAHGYAVDGPIATADVYDRYQTGTVDCATATAGADAKNCWKTLLVGGLGAGGRGYYAVDITSPASPKVMWEFKWSDTCYDPADATTSSADCHIGLTMGSAAITKLVDGRWVVMVSSGMNNLNTPAKTGDGQGYLYVLDAITGQIIQKIGTGAGDASSPAGFTYINAYVENYIQNNTAERVYGGDLLGNLWRIDVQRLTDPNDPLSLPVVHFDVVKVATLLDPSGNPQPITTAPQMSNVGIAKTRMVYVGTGRYLGETDLGNNQTQTIYGIPDNLGMHSDFPASDNPYVTNGNTVYPMSGLTLRDQLFHNTLILAPGDATHRIVDPANTQVCNATAIDAANSCVGWYVDLPGTGERVTVDMRLVNTTLIAASNVSPVNVCDTGANAWINQIDALTGLAADPTKFSTYLGGAGVVGESLIRDQFGRILDVITLADGSKQVTVVTVQQALPLGRRSTWRDLLIDK